MWLFALFVAIPILEIALFIQVGGAIGLGWTLLIVIGTALAGTYLVRSQGAMALGQVRRSLDTLRDPTEPLAHGAMILVAGVLLLTPGFFTDACGFALLLPPVRRRVFRYLAKRIEVRMQTRQHYTRQAPPRSDPRPFRDPQRPARGDVIEGEYSTLGERDRDTPRKPSGWTRH